MIDKPVKGIIVTITTRILAFVSLFSVDNELNIVAKREKEKGKDVSG